MAGEGGVRSPLATWGKKQRGKKEWRRRNLATREIDYWEKRKDARKESLGLCLGHQGGNIICNLPGKGGM